MTQLLIGFITAFITTFFLIPIIIKIFKKKNILESPGRRKIHKGKKPSMGGIAIFLGVFLSILIWLPLDITTSKLKYLYGALVIMFVTGMRDDLVPLKPIFKLLAQVTAALIIIMLADIRLHSLYGLLGIYELPDLVSYTLSLFTIIVITNSFNLIDGLDGLAGSIAMVSLTAFGLWFWFTGEEIFAALAFSLIGSIVAFLNFNWEPSKIFMGDTGALLIGFFLSILAIYFIETNYNIDQQGNLDPFKFEGSISTAVCFLIIPLFDTFRVFTSRAIRGKSPFTPDKTHIHHLLIRLGLNHAKATIVLASINIIFVGIAILGKEIKDYILLPAVIIFTVMLSLLLDFWIVKKYPKKEMTKKIFR